MAMRSRPTVLKRERERARIEKQKQKAARRAEKSQRGPERSRSSAEVDPDIAHIVPGPQPQAEWQIEDEPAADESDEP
jgi:hypothetical protein